MAKILFIISSNYHHLDACGICVKKLITQLQAEGNEIKCICAGEVNEPYREIVNGVELFKVHHNLYKRKKIEFDKTGKGKLIINGFIWLRRLRSFFLLPWFPDVEPNRSLRLFRVAERIIGMWKAECLIGVFRPFDDISAVLRIKKKHNNIYCCGYYLDILRGATISRILPTKWYNNLCDKVEIRIFKQLDLVLMSEAGQEIYKEDKFSELRQKIHYVNFPIFDKRNILDIDLIDYDKRYVNIVYAGSIYRNMRNPEYCFRVFEEAIRLRKEIRLHIYGYTDCIDIINRFCAKFPQNAFYYGIVSYEYIVKAIASADVVLNILNQVSLSVPSKLFELCSSCKPIINVVKNKNDIALKYLSRYPSCCYLNEFNFSISSDVISLLIFLDESCKTRIEYEDVEKLFFDSTPKAITNILRMNMEKCLANSVCQGRDDVQ